jgi:hypothetical protein
VPWSRKRTLCALCWGDALFDNGLFWTVFPARRFDEYLVAVPPASSLGGLFLLILFQLHSYTQSNGSYFWLLKPFLLTF